MTTGLIDAARDEGASASAAKDGRAWLCLFAREVARYTREREQEAIEAEGYWELAEEACAIDPIG